MYIVLTTVQYTVLYIVLYIVLYTKLDSLHRRVLREIYSASFISVYSIFFHTSFCVFDEYSVRHSVQYSVQYNVQCIVQ